MLYRRLAASLFFTAVLLCAVTAFAQSGRRQTKPAPAAPIPTPTPEPTPIPKKDNQEPELIFLVGAHRMDSFSIPFTYYDAIVRGCADRLRSRSSADVDVAQQELSRGDAIKKAKSETKTYVVMMGLSYDLMARSADELIVEFVVFAPQTAKVVTTGRTYLNSNRAGPLVVGAPQRLPGALYREEMLRLAAEDAADRILKKMNLGGVIPR
jgi:hypothetical protein